MTALDMTANTFYDNPTDPTSFQLYLTPADPMLIYLANNDPSPRWHFFCFFGASDPTNGIFPTIAAAASYHANDNLAAITSYYNGIFSTSYTTIGSIYTEITKATVDYVAANSGGGRTTSSLSLSFVGTGATGTQISSTKASTAKINVNLSATASIAGGATSNATLKKCATNSATESDWITALPTIAEIGQSYSLAIALQGVQTDKRQLSIDVPAGWYVKAQNSGTGTHSESITGGEKTIYG